MSIPHNRFGQPDLQALVERAGRRYCASIGEVYVEDMVDEKGDKYPPLDKEGNLKRPAHQGGYQHITAEEWAEYDRAMAAWQEARRHPAQGAAVADDREALCICGCSGEYWRPRKGGGRTIWRCEEHRDNWPEYAEDIPLRQSAR